MERLFVKAGEILGSGLIPFFMPTNGNQGSAKVNVVRIIELLIMLAILTGFNWHFLEMTKVEVRYAQRDILHLEAQLENISSDLNNHGHGF